MSRKLNKASALAMAATVMTIVFSADGSGAAAQAAKADTAIQEPTPQASILITTPQAPAVVTEGTGPETDPVADALPLPVIPKAASLAAMVAAQPKVSDLSRELNCLAGAIYFESKSESLAGQLAVGRVVVARSKSGRFPDSYCGVVFQRSQFSFVRGASMPAIPKASKQWKNAVAIAQIAHSGAWKSPAEGALFFHAAYVSPGWRLTRLARVDNHVFYR
ncbi:cell wall hydrolase [Novosphingobium sp.]|uniref:cell wall hydrolase n=1 Tax=Novosphingobium sp. TaxID=1874826 RepID=UPI0025FB6836|nr:cell wall hydrolase [Novosphingobium sp.]